MENCRKLKFGEPGVKIQNKKKLSRGFIKFCFKAEILRCKNQVVQKIKKHLQVVPKQ